MVGDRIHRINVLGRYSRLLPVGARLAPRNRCGVAQALVEAVLSDAVVARKKPIALGLQVPTVKVMNWVFILIILVLGLGLGGWASIKTMDEKVKEFELFDRCNGC